MRISPTKIVFRKENPPLRRRQSQAPSHGHFGVRAVIARTLEDVFQDEMVRLLDLRNVRELSMEGSIPTAQTPKADIFFAALQTIIRRVFPFGADDEYTVKPYDPERAPTFRHFLDNVLKRHQQGMEEYFLRPYFGVLPVTDISHSQRILQANLQFTPQGGAQPWEKTFIIFTNLDTPDLFLEDKGFFLQMLAQPPGQSIPLIRLRHLILGDLEGKDLEKIHYLVCFDFPHRPNHLLLGYGLKNGDTSTMEWQKPPS